MVEVQSEFALEPVTVAEAIYTTKKVRSRSVQ
jgi:hypothetical protein